MRKKTMQKKEKNRELRRILLENIEIKNLSKENFKEYIEEIETEDISFSSTINIKEGRNIWKQIQEIILNNNDNNYNNINYNDNKVGKENFKNNKVIEHQEGNNFQGIIKYLEDKYGKDIHEQGIITINTSSDKKTMMKVIDYESNSFWHSDGEKYGWWEINFKKIFLNGYSIKTHDFQANHGNHLKNWAIECKNEGEEWKEIDR